MMTKLICRNYSGTDPVSTEFSTTTPCAICTLFNPPPKIISKVVKNTGHSLQMSSGRDSAANNTVSHIYIGPGTPKDAGISRALA